MEYIKTQQNGLMTTTERKNRMMKGASEKLLNKFFKEVMVLEKNLTDVGRCGVQEVESGKSEGRGAEVF